MVAAASVWLPTLADVAQSIVCQPPLALCWQWCVASETPRSIT